MLPGARALQPRAGMCCGGHWFDLGIHEGLSDTTDRAIGLSANTWVVIVGGLIAVATVIMLAAMLVSLVSLIAGFFRKRRLDPSLGFALDGVDLRALRGPGRLALARGAAGRELKRRVKLVDRVLAGMTIAAASERAGVAERVARQWLGLYFDTALGGGPLRRPNGPLQA